jgi:ATP-dependent DNA ligase
MRLEGSVSKGRDRPYQASRSKHWLEVKNRKLPAMEREYPLLFEWSRLYFLAFSLD